MEKWKEVRFDLMGIKYENGLRKEKFLLVYLITNENNTKALCIEFDGCALEIPFDDILNYCRREPGEATYH